MMAMFYELGASYGIPEMANDRWLDVEVRGRLPSEMGQSLESISLNKPPVPITVVGHSFIRHLDTFACTKYGYYHNFKIEQYVANRNKT